MFKLKIANKVTLKVGDVIEVIDRGVDNYGSFKITEIKYSKELESNRVYGKCIFPNNTNFKLGEEMHLFGLEFVREHLQREVIKLIKYEPKNL